MSPERTMSSQDFLKNYRNYVTVEWKLAGKCQTTREFNVSTNECTYNFT